MDYLVSLPYRIGLMYGDELFKII